MKKTFLLLITNIIFTIIAFGQSTGEGSVSSLRIGDIKLFTKKAEVEKIIGKKLIVPSSENNYDATNKIIYNGEKIEIVVNNWYFENNVEDTVVTTITTNSKNFKTKSGIGVGSSKLDIINVFKDQRSFTLYPGYDDNGVSKTESYFVLNDIDAHTSIIFKMVNNVVVEITVSVESEGC